MPASMRIEVFPMNMKTFLDFYVGILQFIVRKHEGTYAYLARDNIFIGAIEVPNSDSLSEKASYRRPFKGFELVFEVDDLVAERDRIVEHGWKLENDIKMQEWGLEDFRLVDPEGYYVGAPRIFIQQDKGSLSTLPGSKSIFVPAPQSSTDSRHRVERSRVLQR